MKANAEAKGLKPIGKSAVLPLADLIPTPSNRSGVGAIPKDDELKGLASSIKNVGLLHPLIVKPDPEEKGRYRIVAGERRWRAMKMLRLESAPCVVLSGKEDDAQAELVRVVENHQRRNLEPLEEAAAVRGLLDIGLEPEAVARSLGRSRAWVARRASLTELSEMWLAAARDPQTKISHWPPSHLEVISRFPAEVQDRMLEKWFQEWTWRVPGFRDLVEMTGRFLHLLSAAPWKLDDETLCPEAGACNVCPKRSSHAPELFEGELDVDNGKSPPGDRCLDARCWRLKADLFLSRKADEMRREHADVVLLNNGEHGTADLEQTFGTEVLSAAEVAAGRKSDGNAVPALVVSGPGMGRVKWVQPIQNGTHTPGANHVKRADPEEPPAEKTPEERRKPYDKRRRQVVIDAVRSRLEALAAEADPERVAQLDGGPALTRKGLAARTVLLLAMLLTDRGWRDHAGDGSLAMPDGISWDDLASLRNHEIGSAQTRDTVLDICRGLLRLAVGRLSARMLVGSGEPSNMRHYVEAEVLCEMLGFDLAALRAEAATLIPYAKAWKDEVTDDWAGSEGATGEEETGWGGCDRRRGGIPVSATTTTTARADKVRDAGRMLDDHIRELARQMEGGKSEQLVRYLEFASRFHSYSFGNVMLILCQRPDAMRVAGLRQWNRLGRRVRAGARGIMIMAPMAVWKKSEAAANPASEDEASQSERDETREKITLFKPVYVFDVSDTEGADLPSLPRSEGDAGAALEAIRDAIRTEGIILEEADVVPGSLEADGASYGGRIVIRNDLDPAETFRTLAHELAHELLHWPKDGRPKEPDKTIRETEADATAFVVCRHFGVTCDSSDYLLLYDSEPRLLLERLETVRATAARIIDAIINEMGPPEPADES